MPERPLLKLPEPVPSDPKPGPRGGGNLVKPTRGRQGARLAPRFDRLMQVAGSPEDLLSFRDDPASIAPERAIVFEVAGQLKDFYAQAQELGMEYLGDYEEDIEPSEDFYDKKKPEKTISGRIYLAMPDVRALQELLGLWRIYQRGERMPRGKSEWRELFSLLIDVRPWGPQDRVPLETITYWQESLRNNPDVPVRFEVELWFHESAGQRERAYARIGGEVAAMGGGVMHHASVPEIRYDAALVDIPPEQAQALIDHPDIALARTDEIMFLRPQAVARIRQREEPEGEDAPDGAEPPPLPTGDPVAALLDGLPIQNHVRLAGRITVDDPDDLEANYPVNRRAHGTEMASLIVHGDLTRQEPPLPRPLLVQPVMQPDARDSEQTPPDRLLVDVIHRAVRRIKVGDGDEPATAPGVVLINLSLGDPWRPFARMMSPFARLLDFLAHRYRVLFLVSAGNVLDRLVIPDYRSSREFENADPEEREKAILAALNSNKSLRTLLSPAESVNALTIGAAHKSAVFNGNLPGDMIDPFTDERLPNIASAMGLGYRKAVKPDLLFEGGRTPVRVVGSGDSVTIQPVRAPARFFGAKAAAPDRAGSARHEDFTWGTSVATALATRAGHRIYDTLMDGGGSYHADLPADYMALALKALLVHGAAWGPKGEMLDGFFGPQGIGKHVARRDDIARLFGFGTPDIDRVLDCAENRATLLGVGTIAAQSALLYRIPIPAGLDGQRAFRALTVTLAWFTPINARHQGYRVASLDVSPGSEEKYWLVDDRDSCQPTDKTIVRGSVFHERRTGEKAAVFVDDGNLLLRVSCRATAGELAEEIPYALAVSFEVGVETGIPVYDEIRTRIAPQVRAGVGA